MKNKLLTLFIAILGFTASAQITFQKTYGTLQGEWAYCVRQTADSGYIMTGGHNTDGILLVKTDVNGDTIFTRTYDFSQGEAGYAIEQTTDGGYIILGTFGTSFLIVKTNSAGDTLWTRRLHNNNIDYGFSIQQTRDGGYILTGMSYAGGSAVAFNDVHLIKLTPGGNMQWNKILGGTFGDNTEDFGYSVKETLDSGYVIAGYTATFGAGLKDVFMVKTDSTGTALWKRVYGGAKDEIGFDVQQTSDSGYIIAGETNSFSVDATDIYLIKTNKNGDTLWTRTYGGAGVDNGRSIQQTSDGGYIISGSTTSFGATMGDAYAIKIAFDGTLQWSKIFGDTLFEGANSIRQVIDGGYIMAGQTITFGSSIYLVKMNSAGNSGCNESSVATVTDYPTTQVFTPTGNYVRSSGSTYNISAVKGYLNQQTKLCSAVGIDKQIEKNTLLIYPNPFINELKINSTRKGTVVLFDVMGKEITRQETFEGESIFNTENIANGFYLLHYSDGKQTKNLKVVKQ